MAQSPKKNRPKKPDDSTGVPPGGFSFEEECFDGSVVYLPPGRWEWKILGTHADMEGYEEEVKSTALDPDLLGYEGDEENQRIHASYGFGRGIYADKYLWVPVRLAEGKWKVKTAHWVGRIDEGLRIVWRRMR